MMMGKREYNEADMLRMQRDAEERVREMQNRARQTVEQDNMNMPPRNRNWNSNPGTRRRRNGSDQYSRQQPKNEQHTEQERQDRQTQRSQEDQASQQTGHTPPPPEPAETKTTIIEDVMGALKLDEDYILIIGLLLILLNQRADTTLILALIYLLI